ncbi:MAG TPA: carbohydrate ABC transporter permease [Chloroflexota bacterium]|nr:carbohydrate ABC transporter permease [Chloroflexota bacterium]
MNHSLSARVKRGLSLARRTNQALLHVVLICFGAVAGGPFIWMVFASFKKYKELVSSSALLPQVWTLDNYSEIINRVNFLSAFRNSLIVSVVITASVLLTASALGYIFAKYRFPGKDALFLAILSTQMVPFAAVLVPLYIFVSSIGGVDRLTGVVLPGLWSTFGLFLMRQFIESIPSEMIDAARIDGASEWWIYLKVVLPLSGAPLAAVAIFHFLWHWDNFLWPSIVLNSRDVQTIPIVLAGLRSLYWTRYDMWMAGSMLTVVPVMLIYVFASRQFVRGIAMTGIKG